MLGSTWKSGTSQRHSRPHSVVVDKIARIRAGGQPRVLDLFSGCGGLSLGFMAEGFGIVAAIESDPLAARSHAENFHGGKSSIESGIHAQARDILQTEPSELCKELGLGRVKQAIDVIVGGPPCQAYARVGRAKLREVFAHPHAFLHDPRRNLYLRYLAYVEQFRPIAVLMENVPDAMNIGGHNVAEEMCEALDGMGYQCAYTLLNAVFYGVPQMRERMFLVGLAKGLDCEVSFPRPTHWTELPAGYEGTRKVALRHLHVDAISDSNDPALPCLRSHYVNPPAATQKLIPAITAQQALEDLPRITLHLEGKLKRGARRFDEIVRYRHDIQLNDYAALMRNWKGFSSRIGVRDHVIRALPRDYQIFRRMNPGDQYPEALQHALNLFQERITELRGRGEVLTDAQYRDLKKSIVPPYDAATFPNKWRKMEADRPARTLMAHISKDTYSHIHYDSSQARTISVREAARLQSFPDGFVFAGTMNPAFRQIGNAVPPLMARAFARILCRQLKGRRNTQAVIA